MKPETLDPISGALPDEELVPPVEAPAEANDGPDGEALEDTDAREGDDEREGKL